MIMNRYWSPIVKELDPYVPGEQPQDQQYIKLNTNESPYPPSPAVHQALQLFDCDNLRRYPDPESSRLVTALADYYSLTPQQVFVGNGLVLNKHRDRSFWEYNAGRGGRLAEKRMRYRQYINGKDCEPVSCFYDVRHIKTLTLSVFRVCCNRPVRQPHAVPLPMHSLSPGTRPDGRSRHWYW